jgi:hypothetical protein
MRSEPILKTDRVKKSPALYEDDPGRNSETIPEMPVGMFRTVPGETRRPDGSKRWWNLRNLGPRAAGDRRAGIFAEATGRARNRIFVADGTIRAFEEDLPPKKD